MLWEKYFDVIWVNVPPVCTDAQSAVAISRCRCGNSRNEFGIACWEDDGMTGWWRGFFWKIVRVPTSNSHVPYLFVLTGLRGIRSVQFQFKTFAACHAWCRQMNITLDYHQGFVALSNTSAVKADLWTWSSFKSVISRVSSRKLAHSILTGWGEVKYVRVRKKRCRYTGDPVARCRRRNSNNRDQKRIYL